jgi:hypothetical protein
MHSPPPGVTAQQVPLRLEVGAPGLVPPLRLLLGLPGICGGQGGHRGADIVCLLLYINDIALTASHLKLLQRTTTILQ